MSEATLGSGIQPAEMPTVNRPEGSPPPVEMPSFGVPEGFDIMGLVESIKAGLRHEMDAAVADMERRYAQARELERSALYGEARQAHAEDLNLNMALLEGFTLTSNSPTAPAIAWASLHVVFQGVDYTISDGNTTNKFVWFVKPGSYTPGTPMALNTSNTQPTLGANDSLLFVNNGGVAVDVTQSNVAYAVGGAVVGTNQLADNAVTAAKTDFYATLSASITTAIGKADAAQATADGSVTTYFQSAAPWADGDATAGGATNPAAKVGDVWYDSDDGQAYRWSGAGGSPANTWVQIEDNSIAAALGVAQAAQTTANSRITTFYAIDTATPTALAIGDLWIVTNQGNKLKRATATGTANWVDVQFGDAAISGIGGAKVGAGIAPSNLTGAGTAPLGAIPQLGPAKLNAAFHMLY